jgi:hypothetical protein
MDYKTTNVKITYDDDEITFNVTYNNVKDVKRLNGSVSIDSYKLRTGFSDTFYVSEKMLDGTVTFPTTFIDQNWGTMELVKKDDKYLFHYFDMDSYYDELDDESFEDGIQQGVTYTLTEKQYQKFLQHLKVIVDLVKEYKK